MKTKKSKTTKKQMIEQMIFEADFYKQMIENRKYTASDMRPYLKSYIEAGCLLNMAWHNGGLTTDEHNKKEHELWTVWRAYCFENNIDCVTFQKRGE